MAIQLYSYGRREAAMTEDPATQDELRRQERYLGAAERAAAEAKRHLDEVGELFVAASEQYAAAANDVLLLSQRVHELREQLGAEA